MAFSVKRWFWVIYFAVSIVRSFRFDFLTLYFDTQRKVNFWFWRPLLGFHRLLHSLSPFWQSLEVWFKILIYFLGLKPYTYSKPDPVFAIQLLKISLHRSLGFFTYASLLIPLWVPSLTLVSTFELRKSFTGLRLGLMPSMISFSVWAYSSVTKLSS